MNNDIFELMHIHLFGYKKLNTTDSVNNLKLIIAFLIV